MKKAIFYIIIFSMITGFVLGRLTANKISNKNVVTVSSQISTQKQVLANVSTEQKHSNLSQQTSYTEKFYSHKGKLTREIIKSEIIGANTQSGTTNHFKSDIISLNSSDKQSITNISYQSNWTLGIYAQPNFLTKPNISDLEFGISYRIFSGIYVAAISDVEFKSPRIGLQFQF